MARKRNGLVPVGDALADLDGPVKELRDASPQALHHFTQADQVHQLVSASEADADLGFMARMMALCSLARTNPGNRHQYKRANGPYKLVMVARTALRSICVRRRSVGTGLCVLTLIRMWQRLGSSGSVESPSTVIIRTSSSLARNS